jgi:hypothetical protein
MNLQLFLSNSRLAYITVTLYMYQCFVGRPITFLLPSEWNFLLVHFPVGVGQAFSFDVYITDNCKLAGGKFFYTFSAY